MAKYRTTHEEHWTHLQGASAAIAITDRSPSLTPSSAEQVDEHSPPMAPSSFEQATIAIFEDIPREVVEKDQNTPHRNSGEVMPNGVTTLLSDLGPIDGRDMILGTGSGVGNIVTQVVLGTSVYKALGIDLHSDMNQLGMDMMRKLLSLASSMSEHSFSVMMSLNYSFRTLPHSLMPRLSTGTKYSLIHRP
ncbi:Hypothetical protein PHPALM_19826 [Phytophthora palmivora]|uniref:DOT1 domain-containing protein n=1 Tax=Phytophthora palmivora TaxID=4796 RepID=A0A2P4XGF9_9STRA|nr:Hypothetical protein PHPALM_19826 [Phytophthora palmivora]